MQRYRIDVRRCRISDSVRSYAVDNQRGAGSEPECRAEISFYDPAGEEILIPWVSERREVGRVIREYQIREAERFLVALFHGADLVAVTRVDR